MHISNQDDGTFIGDGVLSRDGSEGSPLLEVKCHFSIRDESMSLCVSGSADEYPSEHSVTSVPLFCLDGRSPSPLCELGVFSLPLGHGLVEGKVKGIQGSLAIDVDVDVGVSKVKIKEEGKEDR